MAKILIVDDSATERTFLTGVLSMTGHEIIAASDGLEAEEKVRTQRPDLIVLDVVMPGKNGFQVCRTLKKDEQFKKIPIIIATSKSAESDRFWASKQGADEYLVKPYEPMDLILAVKKYLGRPQ